MRLAKEYGLAARVWLDDGRRKARQGKPVVDNPFLDSYSISLVDKAATYERMLRGLPPGLTEWPSIRRTAATSGRRSSQQVGASGKPTTPSSRQREHARSSITKPSASSTTGRCNSHGMTESASDKCGGGSCRRQPGPRVRPVRGAGRMPGGRSRSMPSRSRRGRVPLPGGVIHYVVLPVTGGHGRVRWRVWATAGERHVRACELPEPREREDFAERARNAF